MTDERRAREKLTMGLIEKQGIELKSKDKVKIII